MLDEKRGKIHAKKRESVIWLNGLQMCIVLYIRSVYAKCVLWIRNAWSSCRIEWDWNVSTAIDNKKLSIHFLWPTYTQPSQWILISDCVTISSILNIKYGMSIEHRVLNTRLFFTTLPFSHFEWYRLTEYRMPFWAKKKSIFTFFFPDFSTQLTTESHSFTRISLAHQH